MEAERATVVRAVAVLLLGAKVFAAGAMGFESPQTPTHKLLLDNLWTHLVRP